MDPNSGQWWFQHNKATHMAFFKTWWSAYWETICYKDMFKKGKRQLDRFVTA